MDTKRQSFRQSAEAHDLNKMMEAFAPNAVLHSPISFYPFEGRPAIRQLLSVILEVFEDFRYTDELQSPDGTLALIFRTRIGKREIEGLDLMRFNEAGLIYEFTVMVRPYSGVEALLQAVAPRLAGAEG